MRQKKGLTIVELAVQEVAGFDQVVKKLNQQVILKGQSPSTFNNYIRKVATLCLHFGKLPEELDEDEINDYLVGLARSPLSPSRSNFKHIVYGLRYYFRLVGLNKRALSLPSIKHESKLPVILNRTELKELFKAPTMLKHSIVLALIYSAGMRGQEAVNLKLSDIDFERRTIHIRQSKYKKDRIVPLSNVMARGLRNYIEAENPHLWLFNGKEPDGRYSVRGISWVMRETLKKPPLPKMLICIRCATPTLHICSKMGSILLR